MTDKRDTRQCDGMDEQVHPYHRHSREITAVPPVYETRSIIYCTDGEEKGEELN